MASIQQQPQRWYQDRDAIYRGLARSTWVTVVTDWFMSFAGKSVELVLYATVLYSCAQLYPGVHLPESLNLAVFLVQMGALDIGGLALGKLARQAQEEGNKHGAKHARRLSIGLIAIMLLGVVTVGIERVIPLPTQIQIGVQLVLVIARSVGSVLYGRVVHDLKPVEGSQIRSDELSQELSEQFRSELSRAILQVRQEFSNQVIELSQMCSRQFSELSQELSNQAQSINGLAAFPGIVERHERATKQALAEMRVNLEAAGKPRLSLVGPAEKLSSERVELNGRQFIEDYITKHSEAKNSEVIAEATKVGLTLSQSYVSQIRKAFNERTA